MILMVFGHVWDGLARQGLLGSGPIVKSVYDYIYYFHMPTLFVISGMLYQPVSGGAGIWNENARQQF